MPSAAVEWVRPDLPRGHYRAVLFDFDGTLSLLRECWPRVMIPFMVEVLRQTGTAESEAELAVAVEEFVMGLNGQPTIQQMSRLAEEVGQRGTTPQSPAAYKARFHERLLASINRGLEELRHGTVPRERWAVPGSHALLEGLRQRGVLCYLASGTEMPFVRQEAKLLGLDLFFGPHLYAPEDDNSSFSKRAVVDRLLQQGIAGKEVLAFGDGVVELEEVRRVGGTAVAVAYDEENPGRINLWKRNRLVRAGADLVLADYQQHEWLLGHLFDGHGASG